MSLNLAMGISHRCPIVALPFLFFLTISTSVTAFPNEESLTLPLPNHVLHQFPNRTWVENLAVRSNGGILVTLLSSPDLYLVDPSQPEHAILVHSFPSVSGLRGIAELEEDIFYIAAGNASLATFVSTPGAAVWKVDMRSFSHSSGALVRKVTDIPEALSVNGATALSSFILLIADSSLGLVWKVNVLTGSYSVAISNSFTAIVPTAARGIGVNGIKIRDGYLYFTNSNQQIFCRVPISTISGNATGAVDVVANVTTPDDFALGSDGTAWIAENLSNVVGLLLKNGTVVPIVGAKDQLTVAGATSCAFGRGRGGDHHPMSGILYCSTTGGLTGPVNGTVVEGGKVVAIDTE